MMSRMNSLHGHCYFYCHFRNSQYCSLRILENSLYKYTVDEYVILYSWNDPFSFSFLLSSLFLFRFSLFCSSPILLSNILIILTTDPINEAFDNLKNKLLQITQTSKVKFFLTEVKEIPILLLL